MLINGQGLNFILSINECINFFQDLSKALNLYSLRSNLLVCKHEAIFVEPMLGVLSKQVWVF